MQLTVLDYLRLAHDVPMRELPSRIWGVLYRGLQGWWLQSRDRMLCTHPADHELPPGKLPCWFAPPLVGNLQEWKNALDLAADMAAKHCFDLLGSGPVNVRHGIQAAGVEGYRYQPVAHKPPHNHANRRVAQRLMERCGQDYVPIDWHIDFKSGYRWAEGQGYRQIDYGTMPGVDVKVPWELARCQHLPTLALAALWAPAGRRSRLVTEFQHQVLDFIASNPPRVGVNWCCTMDVAIRAANWVLAYQLLQSGSIAPADYFFECEFKRTLLAHGRHIVDNLEWQPHLRSNHYLSNLCGLLFVAAQLPQGPEADAWLAVAIPELVHECLSQFHPDGSNFEGSTSYHRLSAEMVAYSLALLKSLPEDRVEYVLRQGLKGLRYRGPGPDPRKFVRGLDGAVAIPWELLANRMACARAFASAVIRPDGGVVQIGDNDSGRFFRLTPCRQRVDGRHRRLEPENFSHLVHALSALLHGATQDLHPDAMMISMLSRQQRIGKSEPVPIELREWQEFADFGLFIYRKGRFWCALRCGPVGQFGNGGHAHNDQLSMELCVDGVAFLVDPGTYVYTPLPERRNQLRSTAAHNTVVSGVEQNQWKPGRLGLFSLSQVAKSEVLACNATDWKGRHYSLDGRTTTRTICVNEAGLTVVDEHNGPFSLHFQLMPDCEIVCEAADQFRLERMGCAIRLVFGQGLGVVENGLYSVGYGLAAVAPRLVVRKLSARNEWRVEACAPQGNR